MPFYASMSVGRGSNFWNRLQDFGRRPGRVAGCFNSRGARSHSAVRRSPRVPEGLQRSAKRCPRFGKRPLSIGSGSQRSARGARRYVNRPISSANRSQRSGNRPLCAVNVSRSYVNGARGAVGDAQAQCSGWISRRKMAFDRANGAAPSAGVSPAKVSPPSFATPGRLFAPRTPFHSLPMLPCRASGHVDTPSVPLDSEPSGNMTVSSLIPDSAE
jgi:hypothetical protein